MATTTRSLPADERRRPCHVKGLPLACCVLALSLTGCQTTREQPDVSFYADKAAAIYRDASLQGDPAAMVNLGYLYERGQGVDRDEAEAARLYRGAADKGHLLGQFNLAVLYTGGRGVPQDDIAAVRLFRLASRQGHEKATTYLAAFYVAGRGNIAADDAEAIAALHEAADAGGTGEIWALERLAAMYETGDGGVPKDLDRAIFYTERMADRWGSEAAKRHLGELYEQRRAQNSAH